MSSGVRILILTALVAALAGAAALGGYFWLRNEFNAPGPTHAPLRIEVGEGASIRTVLATLEKQGALHDPRAVEWYVRIERRISGRARRMQAGTYEIPTNASAAQILLMFDQGRVVLEQLTVIEGSRFADLRHALDTHPAVTHALRGKSDAEVMTAMGHAGEFPEGRFFPDTYRFAARTSDLEILSLAYAAMQLALDSAWRARSADLPLQNAYEALTLASIVEKETGLPAERPRIAGVFIGRLRKGMRLQTDPTVIYGLGAGYDGEIHTRDLVTDTPYNTYTRAGLPPTPIALPGRESLLAAVHPQETGDLYFVATGTGDGGHHFSRTLDEHNLAVKHYLENLRSQQHSAGARGPGSAGAGSATGTHQASPEAQTKSGSR
ncbi:MAG TPA: endolytic transglycosylase MltG, partial [Steroidobacteraceae bacterium]|nr:endolytic transglycosylase MltG [Steroidobacteraceae bacterium]